MKRQFLLGFTTGVFSLVISASVVHYLSQPKPGIEAQLRSKEATIARQQLIIDTLKADTLNYVVDHSELGKGD